MNFDFIEGLTQEHVGEHSLVITGVYTPDVLTKIIAELGSGTKRKGVVTYFYNGGIHMIRCDRKVVDDINAKVSELLKTMD